ncbi:MAG: AAA family ATPase [Candidatus Peregrinibacteria bacterium]
MIYLVGGPPRCGKTMLAKVMSRHWGIPWISCDTLQVITGKYMTSKQWRKTHPYSLLRNKLKTNDAFYAQLSPQKIVSVLRRQAKPTFPAIDMASICEIADGNSYIIEGYHIEPSFAYKLIKKYGRKNIKAIFLTKHNAERFAVDVHKSTTPNDWLIVGTRKPITFLKVGQMVALYSRYFEKEAKKYKFKVLNMDQNFKKQLSVAVKYLQS